MSTRHQLHPSASWLIGEDSLVLYNGTNEELELQGESVPLVSRVLAEFHKPLSTSQLEDACGEESREVAEFLLNEGVLVEVPGPTQDPELAEAFSRGVLVGFTSAGGKVTAERVAVRLRAHGVEVQGPVELGKDYQPPAVGLWLTCFASPYDPVAMHINEAALAKGTRWLPVFLGSQEAFIGPLVASPGPCARCTVLRLVARAMPKRQDHWALVQSRSGTYHAAQPEDAQLEALGDQVMGFLAARDKHGRIEGLDDALIRVSFLTGLAEPHRVLKHMRCASCAPQPASAVERDALSRAAAQTAARWQHILSDDPEVARPTEGMDKVFMDKVVGLLSYGEEWSQAAHYFRNMPEVWGGIALSRPNEWVTTSMQGINGTGATLENVRLVAFSEGVERYAQYAAPPALVDIPYREVKDFAYDPRGLTLYTDDQYDQPGFPRPRFREDLPLQWSWGYGLFSQEAKLFPHEVISVALTDAAYKNRILQQSLTSGGASHVSYTRALHNALRELIERDQLMLAWYKQISLPRVRIPDCVGDDYTDSLLEYLRRSGVELSVFDMRLDFRVPSFLVLGRVHSTIGAFEVGGTVGAAATDLDPRVALGRALAEMRIHYETLAFTPDPTKDWRNNPYDPHDVAQGWGLWWPNYMYHLNPANLGAFRFLDESPLATDWAEIEGAEGTTPQGSRDKLLASYQTLGLEPWVWDLTHGEVAGTGFKVLKVEVPGIMHLVPGRQSRRLNCARFEKVAASLGRPCLPPGVVNPHPHVQA